MYPVKVIVIFFVLFPLPGITIPVLSQNRMSNVLTRRVPAFRVSDDVTSLALEKLAQAYGVPIGMEAVSESATKKIKVEVVAGTVRTALNAIIQADANYKWEYRDGIVDVFPVSGKNQILEVIIRDFRVDKLNKEEAARAVTELPEVKAKVEELGLQRRDFRSLPAQPYSSLPRFSLELHNKTLREILDRIVKASGSNYWKFYRHGDKSEYFSIDL